MQFYQDWLRLFPTTFYLRGENTYGSCGNQTRCAIITSQHSIHYTMTSRDRSIRFIISDTAWPQKPISLLHLGWTSFTEKSHRCRDFSEVDLLKRRISPILEKNWFRLRKEKLRSDFFGLGFTFRNFCKKNFR